VATSDINNWTKRVSSPLLKSFKNDCWNNTTCIPCQENECDQDVEPADPEDDKYSLVTTYHKKLGHFAID
jgi:hypothetical protein